MKYQEKPDITLKEIIENGFIEAKTEVFAYNDDKISGILNTEGGIEIEVDGIKKTFPFPSGAARAFAKTSVNGWKFWKIKFNDEFIELAELKQRYLNR